MNSPTNTEKDLNTLEGKLAFLRHLPFFSNTPLETVQLYAYLCNKEQYKAREPIVVQGEPADRLFLIISGKVAICKDYKDREFHLQMLSGEGLNYFGELTLLAEFDWFFSAHAMTDVTLLSISREAFTKVMEKFPDNYTETIAKIVRLRITRFDKQTNYLLENLKEEAWLACGTEKNT
jgi:CRP-like cAMP-binding protein